MDVKRYWISPNGIACEDVEGKFVRYEDYAKLANDFLFVAFGVKDAEENPVDDDTYNAASRFIDESKN